MASCLNAKMTAALTFALVAAATGCGDAVPAVDSAGGTEEAATEQVSLFEHSEGDQELWGGFVLPWADEVAPFQTVAEMTRQADLVVVGRVAAPFVRGLAGPPEDLLPFTVAPVRVDRALAGDVAVGGVVNVVLPGEPPEATPKGHVLVFLTSLRADETTVVDVAVSGTLYPVMGRQALFVSGPDGQPVAPLDDAVREARATPDHEGRVVVEAPGVIVTDALARGTFADLVASIRDR